VRTRNYQIDFKNFLEQLQKNGFLESTNTITKSIDNYEDSFPEKSKYIGSSSGFEKVLASLLKPRLEQLINELYYATEQCESPIEVFMLYALLCVGAEYHDTVNIQVDGKALFKVGDSPYELMIEPQKKIDKYRVDFLLTSTDYNPKFRTDGYYQKKLVVECDGFEFHGTKEKIQKDKERDRKIQSLGYFIYHYTGSEIWRDIILGTKEIMAYFINRNIA
jgi:very-short-patch-repair endonuclease